VKFCTVTVNVLAAPPGCLRHESPTPIPLPATAPSARSPSPSTKAPSSLSRPARQTRLVPAYVEALVQRQLERDRLRELIEDAEAEHGPVDQASFAAERAVWRGDTTDLARSADAS
jgi:hypothetical protein